MAKIATVSLERGGDVLFLSSPYRPDLPPRLKALGGKWQPETKTWIFELHRYGALRSLCKEFWDVDVTVGDVPHLVTHSHASEAVTLATKLAALMAGMDEEKRELIFTILFEGGEQ